MVKIKNISQKRIWVPNFPIFAAGEVREVSEEDAKKLKLSPFLEEFLEVEESLEAPTTKKIKVLKGKSKE